MKGVSAREGYNEEFLKKHGAPPGSIIVITENAYLTNEVWDEDTVPQLIKTIRNMPVIRDHPTWWVKLYLDGFGAHVDSLKSQQAFTNGRILVVKENSNSSQVNQAFDKHAFKTIYIYIHTYIYIYIYSTAYLFGRD